MSLSSTAPNAGSIGLFRDLSTMKTNDWTNIDGAPKLWRNLSGGHETYLVSVKTLE